MLKTISIAHQKGGVGKSLLSLQLCGAIDGCVIFDLDNQNSCSFLSAARDKPFEVINIETEKELNNALDKYEGTKTIIIDCGGFDSTLNRTAIANSDIVLAPVKDNSFEMLALKRFVEIMHNIHVKSDVKAYALINNVNALAKDFERLESFVSKNNDIGLLKTVIRQRADFPSSLDAGTTVTEVSKFSKASIEIYRLIDELKSIKGVNNG